MRLTARDTVDSGRNAVIENSLEARQYSQFFTIDPDSGQIRLGRPLPSVGSGEFQLSVAATDQGSPPLTSTATITLMLSGQNTAAPQFSDVSTQVIIPENEPPGSLIIKLTAEDRDPGINGMVRYHIVAGNQEEHFRMDEKTEQISPPDLRSRTGQQGFRIDKRPDTDEAQRAGCNIITLKAVRCGILS